MTAPAAIKPIRTDAEHRAALAEIETLFDAAPGTEAADRLEVLTILVAAYEQKQHPIEAPDPVAVLDFAMRAQGRTQADLAALLGSRSRASEVLNRRRALTRDMIDKLATAWGVPADLLSAAYPVRAGMPGALKRGLAATAVVAVLGTAALAGTIGGMVWAYGDSLPSTAELADYVPADMRRYDESGRLAAYRRFVPLSAIPAHVVGAFLAAEDQDFYAHDGYDVWAMVRAAGQNLMHPGSKPAGASTITQQLAKNLLLPGKPPSFERKTQEVLLARRIEAALSKERILELYLNEIYFGGRAYGIAAAAEQYFHKRPADLTVAEAAYLAALPKAPNHYRIDVAENRDRAKTRRDWVLGRMADDGFITVSAATFARAEPLTSAVQRP